MGHQPEIKTIPGERPEFWDRSAIFFANLLSIFYGNQGQTESLKEEVGGLETYGGRLMPVIELMFTGGRNMLVLEAPPDKNLLNYFSNTLKLELPDYEIVPHSTYTKYEEWAASGGNTVDPVYQRLHDHPGGWIDGFVTDPTLVAISEQFGKKTISSLEGSRRGNNKLLLHEHLVEQGQPVFDTVVAADAEEVDRGLEKLRVQGYKGAVVKAQVGASGIGMLKTSTDASARAAVPEYFYLEGPCMVQGWLEPGTRDVEQVDSPSVQMFLDDTSVSLYDITEQILSEDSIHQGNMAPPPYLESDAELREQLLKRAGVAGTWLHGQGYRGTASADFLVVRRSGSVEALVCEINARVTGATYPAIVARHFLPHGAWLMRNIMFRNALDSEGLIEVLETADALYRPGEKKGVIPINFNSEKVGTVNKGQFLFIDSTTDGCMEQLDRVEAMFPVEVDYDRD